MSTSFFLVGTGGSYLSPSPQRIRVAGVDEVGRGPIAGPVVAAAVVFREGYLNPAIIDSKKLSATKREALAREILSSCDSWAVGIVGPRRIDKYNILEATKLAMVSCVQRIAPDRVLIDGPIHLDIPIDQEGIVGGDALISEISAASIVAKVWRDSLMSFLDTKYPGYEFARHSGYPTSLHLAKLEELGPSPLHRRSFEPVRKILSKLFTVNTFIDDSTASFVHQEDRELR
jgi:ribonuclease HII